MKSLYLTKIITVLLTLVFFITSCTTPNSNIQEESKSILQNKNRTISSIGKSASYFLHLPDKSFSLMSEGGVACNTSGQVHISGTIPSGCDVTINFIENGNTIKTLNNPSVGFHNVMWGCSCGVERVVEISGTKTGSSCSSFSLPSEINGSFTIPCPNEDRPEENIPEEDCGDDAQVLLPNTLNDLGNFSQGFSGQSYTPSDIHESISDLINLQVKLRNLQEKYNNLNTRGFTTEASTINSQITTLTAERDDLKNGLVSKISTRKSNLRAKVNAVLDETNSDIFTDPITPLEDYERNIYDTGANLEHSADTKTTINANDFVDAYKFLADEYELLSKFINDVINGSFSNNQIQAESLLNSFSNQALRHQITLKSEIEKFNEKAFLLAKKSYPSILKAQEFMEIVIIKSMAEQGVINPSTGAINTGFSISGYVPPTNDTLEDLKNTVVTAHGSVTNLMNNINDTGFEKVAEFIEGSDWNTYSTEKKASIVQDYKNWGQRKDFPKNYQELLPYYSNGKFQIQWIIPLLRGALAASSKYGPKLYKALNNPKNQEKIKKAIKKSADFGGALADLAESLGGFQELEELLNRYVPCWNKTPRDKLIDSMNNAHPDHAQYDWVQEPKPSWYPPKGWQVHHIVEECKPSVYSAKSRSLLKKFGMDDFKTNPDNLIQLPGKNPNIPPIKLSEQSPPVSGWDNATEHQNYDQNYDKKVYERLENKVKQLDSSNPTQKTQGQNAIKQELRSIQQDLKNGVNFW